MESRHIRINYEDILIGKKSLLSAEMDILQIIKRIRNYKILRQKESSLKNKLRTQLVSVRSKTTIMQKSFPQDQPMLRHKKRKEIKIQTPSSDIQNEIEEIRKRLSSLQ